MASIVQAALTVIAAALLAYTFNRILDERRARREFAHKIISDVRDDIRSVVEVAVGYWAGGVLGEDRAVLEAKIRLLEQDVRSGLKLLDDELSDMACAKLDLLLIDLMADLTGGCFESTDALVDLERARRIAAIGAKLRREITQSWRTARLT